MSRRVDRVRCFYTRGAYPRYGLWDRRRHQNHHQEANNAGQIIGLDLSRGQIQAAKQHPTLDHIAFVEGDGACCPFRDGVFDKVFITHALHEMPRSIRQKVMGEARRILKDRGEALVLELDNPPSFTVRLLIGLWFFYWLPFNPETPTRKRLAAPRPHTGS